MIMFYGLVKCNTLLNTIQENIQQKVIDYGTLSKSRLGMDCGRMTNNNIIALKFILKTV